MAIEVSMAASDARPRGRGSWNAHFEAEKPGIHARLAAAGRAATLQALQRPFQLRLPGRAMDLGESEQEVRVIDKLVPKQDNGCGRPASSP